MSKKLNLSSSAVVKTIQRMTKLALMRTAPGKGRPRVTSAAEKFIRVNSLRNCKSTAPEIRAHIKASQSTDSSRHVSISTIAAKKPLLRKNNKKKGSAWAKKHKEWTLGRWKSELWSDMSKFEMFGSTCRVFVRHRKERKG